MIESLEIVTSKFTIIGQRTYYSCHSTSSSIKSVAFFPVKAAFKAGPRDAQGLQVKDERKKTPKTRSDDVTPDVLLEFPFVSGG